MAELVTPIKYLLYVIVGLIGVYALAAVGMILLGIYVALRR